MYLLHKIGKGIKTEIELVFLPRLSKLLGSEARDLLKDTTLYTFFDPVEALKYLCMRF